MIEYNTAFQAVPFDKIKAEHFIPAFETLIGECRNGLQKIAGSAERPDFQNTIEALERLNYKLKRLEQIFFNLNSAETTKEIQQIAQEVSPLLTAYYNDITLNEALFARVNQVYSKRPDPGLNQEQSKLLEDTYKMFVRNGANLSDTDKSEYRRLTEELSQLALKFDENLLHETNSYQLHVTNEKDLSGLPDFVREAAEMEAKAKNITGWLFTLKAPSFTPFMKYADNRALRETLYRAYSTRSFKQNDKDNQEVIRRLVNLRLRMANLLGFKSYAAYVLEERMAGNPDRVNTFLLDLLKESKPAAEK